MHEGSRLLINMTAQYTGVTRRRWHVPAALCCSPPCSPFASVSPNNSQEGVCLPDATNATVPDVDQRQPASIAHRPTGLLPSLDPHGVTQRLCLSGMHTIFISWLDSLLDHRGVMP